MGFATLALRILILATFRGDMDRLTKLELHATISGPMLGLMLIVLGFALHFAPAYDPSVEKETVFLYQLPLFGLGTFACFESFVVGIWALNTGDKSHWNYGVLAIDLAAILSVILYYVL